MKRSRCPKCAALGNDLSGNNLATYPDGHSWCYACRFYQPGSSILKLRSSLGSPHSHSESLNLNANPRSSSPTFNSLSDSDLSSTYDLTISSRSWLQSYGISKDEIHQAGIWYDTSKDYLVFPIYDGTKLVCYNARYFGPRQAHPKYITWGNKNGFFKLFPQPKSNIYVLCEDFVSAIKIGRQYNAIPLLGCLIPHKLILSLIPSLPCLRIWLDPDKSQEALVQTQRCLQYHSDCATIVSTKDPKEHTDQEIKDYVESSLSRSESISRPNSLPKI